MRALERLRFATRARVTLTANFIVTLCWSTTAPGLEDVADPQWDSFADGAGGDDEESSDTVTALWGYEVRPHPALVVAFGGKERSASHLLH